MSEPFILALRPIDTPDYMTDAWIGCIQFAIGQPEIVEQFRRDTGLRWTLARNGFEQAIDTATGADRAFIEAFIKWANVNVWGPMDGPQEPS